MGNVVFDNGHTVIEAGWYTGARLGVVFTFSSFGENDPSRDGFGQQFLEKQGYAVVSVKKRRDNWYRDLSFEDFTKAVGPLLAGFDRRFTYGTSMGGYAALYYSTCIGATAIAISPRNSIDPRFLITSYSHFITSWPTQHRPLPEISDPSLRPYVVFDPLVSADKTYIEREVRPAFPVAHFVEFAFSGHPSAQAMLEVGKLKQFAQAALGGEWPGSRIVSAGSKRRSAVIVNEMSKWAVQRNRLELGARLSEKAVVIGGGRPDFLYQQVGVMIASGAFSEAKKATQDAILTGGGTVSLYHRLSSLCSRLEEPEQALGAVNAGLELSPRDVGLLRTRRNLREKRGDLDAAFADALTVMEILPDSMPDRMQLAGLLIAKGAHAEALKHLNANPDASLDLSTIRRKRVCLEALGRVREAEEAALGVIALVPDSFSDMVHLANLYFKAADTDRAVAWLDRAIAIAPDNVSLFRRKRNYLEAAGRTSEAIDAATCVQRLLPSSKADQLRLRKLQLRRYHEQGRQSRTAVVARIRQQSAVASRALVETEQFALFPTLLSSAMNFIAGEEIGLLNASGLLLGLAS